MHMQSANFKNRACIRTLGFNPKKTVEKTCCSSKLFSKY